MLRKTLTILSLIGLALSMGLWARSYCWIDGLLIPTTRPGYFEAASILGVIRVGLVYDSGKPPVKEVRYIVADAQEYEEGIRRMRTVFRNVNTATGKFWRNWNPIRPFRWDNSTITWRGATYRTKTISFPHWLFVLVFSIPLFVAGKRVYRRRKRKKLGLCVKCGYDLRASKDRCPECGTEFEKT
ncbi:MAG: hypothetical protein IIB58_05455 [Planctomycetes bacterium]|nr:hypothetical protein [Planctomycetota bacterium]